MKANLLRSAGHFSIFRTIFVMTQSGWSLLVLCFLSLQGGSYMDVSQYQYGLSFPHPFGYVCLFQVSIHFYNRSFMERDEFFKTRIYVYHHGLEFSNFVYAAHRKSRCIFALGPSPNPCNLFSMFFILSAFLLWLHRPHILIQIVFLSSHSVVGMSSHFSTFLLEEFPFVVSGYPVLSVLFDLISLSF